MVPHKESPGAQREADRGEGKESFSWRQPAPGRGFWQRFCGLDLTDALARAAELLRSPTIWLFVVLVWVLAIIGAINVAGWAWGLIDAR